MQYLPPVGFNSAKATANADEFSVDPEMAPTEAGFAAEKLEDEKQYAADKAKGILSGQRNVLIV